MKLELSSSGTVTLRKLSDRPTYRNYDFQKLTLTSPLGRHSLDGSVTYDEVRPQYKMDMKAANSNNKYLVVQAGYEKGAGPDNETSAHVAFLSSQYPLYGFKYTYYTNAKDNMVRNVSSRSF